MTFNETLEIIYILQSNYPSFYTKQTDKQAEVMAQLWSTIFKEYDLNVVTNALMIAILKKKDFPPNVAEVNDEIIKILNPDIEQVDGETAWGKAQELVKNYGDCLFEEQKETLETELNKDEALRMTLRACGGLHGLRICEIDNLNTLRAQFIRIYNSYSKHKQDYLLLPNNIKDETKQIQQNNIDKSNNIIKMISDKLSM